MCGCVIPLRVNDHQDSGCELPRNNAKALGSPTNGHSRLKLSKRQTVEAVSNQNALHYPPVIPSIWLTMESVERHARLGQCLMENLTTLMDLLTIDSFNSLVTEYVDYQLVRPALRVNQYS